MRAHILCVIAILEVFLSELGLEEVRLGYGVASSDVYNQVNSPNQRFRLIILTFYQ